MSPLPPWLQPVWQRLCGCAQRAELGHALLLRGAPQLGKALLARQFLAWLNCLEPADDGPCEACAHCRQRAVGAFADFLEIAPPEGAQQIGVEPIRALSDYCNVTPQAGRYRTVLILSADRMNLTAANALLKTLEEPAQDTVIFLVSDRAAALPATVRSRCQMFLCTLPEAAKVREWAARSGRQISDPRRPMAQDDADARRQRFFQALDAIVQGRSTAAAMAVDHHGEDIASLLAWLLDWVALQLPQEHDKKRQSYLFWLHDQCIDRLRGGLSGLSAQSLLEFLLYRLQPRE